MAIKKPKPFQRPSVSLSALGSVPGDQYSGKRSWTRVPYGRIHPGDVIPDHGKVVSGEVNLWLDPATGLKEHTVRLVFVSGKSRTFDAEETVFAFTAAADA